MYAEAFCVIKRTHHTTTVHHTIAFTINKCTHQFRVMEFATCIGDITSVTYTPQTLYVNTIDTIGYIGNYLIEIESIHLVPQLGATVNNIGHITFPTIGITHCIVGSGKQLSKVGGSFKGSSFCL